MEPIRIQFGSRVKGYSVDTSDDDVIIFEKSSPNLYLEEFVLGRPRQNKHIGDCIHSTELIGLRGIITGKCYHLALYQWQIPTESALRQLVDELSREYYDRIYNVLRKRTVNLKNFKGKNVLQQLYVWQAACYLATNKKCPDFHFKFPECLTHPTYERLYNKYLANRDQILSQAEVDELYDNQPIEMEPIDHDDEKYYRKILNFLLDNK